MVLSRSGDLDDPQAVDHVIQPALRPSFIVAVISQGDDYVFSVGRSWPVGSSQTFPSNSLAVAMNNTVVCAAGSI